MVQSMLSKDLTLIARSESALHGIHISPLSDPLIAITGKTSSQIYTIIKYLPIFFRLSDT